VTFTPDDVGFERTAAFLRSELDAGRAVVGHIAAENLYILCNPAIASPGLQLMTAEDLKRYRRSDHYGQLSNGVLSRPAIAIDTTQCRNHGGPQS